MARVHFDGHHVPVWQRAARLGEQAVRFAARSESVAALNDHEREAFEAFVTAISESIPPKKGNQRSSQSGASRSVDLGLSSFGPIDSTIQWLLANLPDAEEMTFWSTINTRTKRPTTIRVHQLFRSP